MATLSNGKTLVTTSTGVKIGRAGRLLNTPSKLEILETMEKGDRRKIRKALRAAGRTDLSRL